MKPAVFDYHRATSMEHACELLSREGEDAKILAGGQSLIAAMNFRLARPKVLVDVSHVESRNRIDERPTGIEIAATTTQRYAERHPALRRRLPVLATAIEHIAHFQIRNKGTVGGSIVNADPASELPAMSLLLDAEFSLQSSSGRQVVPAEEFFITYMTTMLQPDELLASILFTEPPSGSGWGFHEVARRSGDFALAGSSAVVGLDDGGRCTHARVVLFGVAATPVRAHEVEAALIGQQGAEELFKDAVKGVQGAIDPESDVHVSEQYRRQVAEVLTARALSDAFDRAQVTA